MSLCPFPLPFPYCCLCFHELQTDECWQDERGVRWDICVPCKRAEQREGLRRNLTDLFVDERMAVLGSL